MGVVYDAMDMINQQRFELIMSEWLNSIIITFSPAVKNVIVKLISQRLQPISKRRRLMSTSLDTGKNVIMDLNVAGIEHASASSATANVQFRDNLMNIFQNETKMTAFVSMIHAKATNDPLYAFFRYVSNVSVPSSVTPSPDQRNGWIPGTIGGVVGGLGFLIIGLAVLLFVIRFV